MLYVLLVGMSRVDYKNMARIYLEVCTLKAFPIPYINQNNPRSFISNAQLHGIFFYSRLPLCNNLLCLRNGVDGRSTDDTTSNRKMRTGVHEESIDFPCTLAALIDTPAETISIKQDTKTNERLTRRLEIVHVDNRRQQRHQGC